MLTRMVAKVTNTRAAGQAVALLERLDARATQVLRVLTYHRVANPEQTPHLYPRVTVTPRAFEQQMEFLSRHYQVVAMPDVLAAQAGSQRLPERPVLVTFDDAYTDFAEYALPILRRFRLPATLFVPTAFPDHPERAFWWDQLHAALACAQARGQVHTPVGDLPVTNAAQRKQAFNRLRAYVKSTPHQAAMEWVDRFSAEIGVPTARPSVLSWDALRQIAQEGVTLGPHTRTHPMMDQISVEEARAEAAGSWQDLRHQIGETLPIFAYPSGGYNQDVLQVLAQEGFQLAFTTQRGLNDARLPEPLQIKRINVGPTTTPTLLRAQLLSWMKYADSMMKTSSYSF